MEIQLIGTASALKWHLTFLSFFLYFSPWKRDSSTLLPKIRWVPLKGEAGLAAETPIPPSQAIPSPLSQHSWSCGHLQGLLSGPQGKAQVLTSFLWEIQNQRVFSVSCCGKIQFLLAHEVNSILLDEAMLVYFSKTTGVKPFYWT